MTRARPREPAQGRLRAAVERVVSEPGAPLPAEAGRALAPRLGFDLSRVRVHVGEPAADAARALGARAFAAGEHVAFGAGEYAPHTPRGRGLLAHELVHVAQGRGRAPSLARVEPREGPAEAEAREATAALAAGLPAPSLRSAPCGVALTPTSAAILPLISYSLGDLAVTGADERAVLAHLRADPDLSATVRDLHAAGMLDELISRVDEPAHREELLAILGSGCDAASAALVQAEIAGFPPDLQILFNVRRNRLDVAAPAFNRAPHAHLVGGPTQPFSGVGATGVNPTTHNIPAADYAALAVGHGPMRARYSNPIPGSLPGYLGTLSATDRRGQVELMFRQPISTLHAGAYAGRVPSRAEVVTRAATRYRLRPAHLGAFLLAEQRDQSTNEDAVDATGGAGIRGANTSIGLGQVVVTTAQNHALFQDFVSSAGMGSLGHRGVARGLASDELNIFAAARYVRLTADAGARHTAASLPRTAAAFPAIDFAKFADHSSTWPDDNLRALASEYTSTAWDDRLSIGWANFVLEAFRDIVASGVL